MIMQLALIFLVLICLNHNIAFGGLTSGCSSGIDKTMLEELKKKMINLENMMGKIAEKESSDIDSIAVTYTRWGRTDCPGKISDLVYSGFVGGSNYDHSGAAVDYLCLPKDPDLSGKDVSLKRKGCVYGAEYEIDDDVGTLDASFDDHDVPCAVCRSVGFGNLLMVPGKTTCTESWTKQYSGYLMSGYYKSESASQYICVDKDAEKIPATSNNDNGKLLYLVEAKCGFLKCPPYKENKALPCVVCSK